MLLRARARVLRLVGGILFVGLSLQTAWPAAISSNGAGGGNWSDSAAWNPAQVPTTVDLVTIMAGDTVTVDTTTAVASTTTVNGRLYFSRVVSSSLTIVSGNLTVDSGGTLDMGTAASPINAFNATLILASGTIAGQYGLIIDDGGAFTIYGAVKTSTAPLTADGNSTDTSIQINTTGLGWVAGDTITVDLERFAIVSLSGSQINLSGSLSQSHPAATTIVADLTRNVVVMSSGTDVGHSDAGNSAYLENLVTNAADFSLANGEFAYLGNAHASGPDYGISFYGPGVTGSISSCTVHDGDEGIYLSQASSGVFMNNLLYHNADSGIQIDPSSSRNTFNSNIVYANLGGAGIELASSDHNSLTANIVYGHGNRGIFLQSSNNNTLTDNIVYSNVGYGFYLPDSNNNTFTGNSVYSNHAIGFGLQTSYNNTLTGNNVHDNQSNGLVINVGDGNTLTANKFYSNQGKGILIFSSNSNTLTANIIYSNQEMGILMESSTGDTLVSNVVYSNGGVGLDLQAAGILSVGDQIGYDALGNPSPDSSKEIALEPFGTSRLTIKKSLVNPSTGISLTNLMGGSNILDYSTNTGTVNVYGDYEVSGSTFTLDFATNSYASSAASPLIMMGGAGLSSETVDQTVDANAVNQLITLTYQSGAWQVTGSLSGSLGSYASLNKTAIPTINPQFFMTISGTPATGDSVNFALLAASHDPNSPKQLFFVGSDPSENNGRAQMNIDASGGFVLKGQPGGIYSLMDMLPNGGTYYTFSDGGAFTVMYSSISNVDENGIQLSGNSGITMATSTFDLAGNGVSNTSTLITLDNLSNIGRFSGLTFGNSRPNGFNYNISVPSGEGGLLWIMTNYGGALAGPSHTYNDPLGRILWGSGPNVCQTVTSLHTGSWSNSATWNGGFIPTYCNPVDIAVGTTVTLDTNTAISNGTTVDGTLSYSRSGDNELQFFLGNITIQSGGTLDMGTSASPITQGTTATLTLAMGQTAGQYGLIVNNGGVFTVYGGAKTSTAPLTADGNFGDSSIQINTTGLGWVVGDSITVDTERFVIAALSSSEIDFSGSLSRAHPAGTAIVADLTRNVVVMSSGTDVGLGDPGNSAHIENLATNAGGFSVTYGEFAYLGHFNGSGPDDGIRFVGAGVSGTITQSTMHDGARGISLAQASRSVFTDNLLYNNADAGLWLDTASNNIFTANILYANQQWNFGPTVSLSGASRNAFVGNTIVANLGPAVSLTNASDNNTLIANTIASNDADGIDFSASNNNRLVSNSVYSNLGYGLYLNQSVGLLSVGDQLGYDPFGNPSNDSPNEIYLDPSGPSTLTVEKSLVNPAAAISLTGLVVGSSILDYSTQTATVNLYGDYLVSGSTFTLDYATNSYPSSAASPQVMAGGLGLTGETVNQTVDANAISQWMTLTYQSGAWQVTGSSSGSLGSYASLSNTAIPTINPQFFMTITGTPAPGDIVSFALLAASQDPNTSKQLFFMGADPGFNNGLARMQIDSTGGFVLKGASTSYNLMDVIPNSGLYYTFADSGTFTLVDSSISHTDTNGLSLNGSGGVSMAESAFDNAQDGGGSSATYITANALVSTMTFYGLNFNNSGNLTQLYNINVLNGESDLNWFMYNYGGSRAGAAYTGNDPDNKIVWGVDSPPGVATITTVSTTSITVTYPTAPHASGYAMNASTSATFIPVAASSVTADESLDALMIQGLFPNTTYFLQIGAAYGSSTTYNLTTPSTSTLAAKVSGAEAYQVTTTSITVAWLALPETPSSSTAEGYELDASTVSDFSRVIASSITADTAFSTLTVTNLSASTLYYLRVGALNWDHVPHFITAGSTLTATLAGAPQTPEGLLGTLDASQTHLTISWHVVTKNVSGQAIAIDHYIVERAATLPGIPTESISVNASVLSYTETADGQLYYYDVQAVDAAGRPSGPSDFIDSSSDVNRIVLAADDPYTRLIIPRPLALTLVSGNNLFGTDLAITVTHTIAAEINPVLRSYDFEAQRMDTNAVIPNFGFSARLATMAMSYPSNADGAPSSGRAPPFAETAPEDSALSLYWFNGREFLPLGGTQLSTGLVASAPVQNLGPYQVRKNASMPHFSFVNGSPYPRILTPNIPNQNNRLFFFLNVPLGSPITGAIYDLQGAKVRDLQVDGNSLSSNALVWDVRDGNGNVVPSGIYLYRVSSNGDSLTGSVVVAR